MTIASDLFRTVIVKINDISQQLPYIVVNQADDNGKIIRFVPMDHGQKVTGFTGARLYYPPRSDDQYGDYVTGVESDGAWDFTIPVGVLSVGRVGCNLAFIDGDGETYSRNVVFLVEPAVSGVFDPDDGQQTRLDKDHRHRADYRRYGYRDYSTKPLITLLSALTKPLVTLLRTSARPRNPLMRV